MGKIGYNGHKSCAQVAIGMLLTYYDSCLSDNIVAENYDLPSNSENGIFYNSKTSPGVVYDRLPIIDIDSNNVSEEYPVTYDEHMNNMRYLENTSLHSKLVCLAEDLNYYDEPIDPDEEKNFGLELDEAYGLLNYYLEQETNFDESDYDIIYESYFFELIDGINDSENHINDVIQFVESGQPVILFIFEVNQETQSLIGHAVIAYDYDSITNELFCHFGYRGDVMCHAKPQDYNYFLHAGYMAINWNIEHSCSDNYEVNGIPYCYEHKDLVVFNHECSYTDGIQEFEHSDLTRTIKHKKMCHCTNYVVEDHTSTCGCSRLSHQFNIYKYYSSTQHKADCIICGETVYSTHVAKKNNPGYCITCGSYFDSGFGQIIHSINPNGRLVTANGSYVGLYGIIYLDERDVQAYLNGTLVFYKEDSSAQIA